MQVQCIVKPNSKVDRITVDPDGLFRIKIKAQPVDGEANEYLVKYLASVFDLPKSNIQIIAGFTNSHKRVNIVAEEKHIQNIISKF